MGGGVYRPGASAILCVPNVGTASERVQQEHLDDVTKLHVFVHKVRLESNNHNEADVCEISFGYDEGGIDPRFLSSAEIYVHLGDRGANGIFTPSADNLRFIGIAVDVRRTFDENVGKTVTVRAHDYTTLFLNAKQYPPSGIPKLSMTLGDAWNLVCDSTGYYDLTSESLVSTVQRLKTNGKNDSSDRLFFTPDAAAARNTQLGVAVASRIAKMGAIEMRGEHNAWDVWQRCVGSLGLISFIRNDRCIVTTATDYYTADDPPRYILGKNIKKLEETRDTQAFSKKNVRIESLNPLTMRTIEAFWPPLSLVKQSKKVAASSLGGPVSVRADDYETFMCPMPITDQDALTAFAERVWLERGRQELSGTLETAEMYVDTLSGASFDQLKLQAGDRIRVEIDRESLTVVQRLTDIGQRTRALQARGYSADMATYLAKNLDAITRMTPEFQVHSAEVELETSPGSLMMTVKYLNRIDVSGSAQPGNGVGTPPVTNQKKTVANPAGQRQRNGTTAPGGR